MAKGLDVKVVGSDATVGGNVLTLEGTELRGEYAKRPTVAQAQAATGVSFPSYYATDTGNTYVVSGGAWVLG